MSRVDSTTRGLPCVVQVGFAGPRRLFESSPADEALLHQQIQDYLTRRLKALPAELGLRAGHFLCGISQVAIGADMLFTRALRDLDLPQRVFLPQHRDAYLRAVGSSGVPDFGPADRAEAERLLASDHVIQERMVSDASSRQERFEDVNVEIVRVSDVIVCLTRADTDPNTKAGGTANLLDVATQHEKPVLEIRLSRQRGQDGQHGQDAKDAKDGQAGKVEFQETWHHRDRFQVPELPEDLRGLSAQAKGLPSVESFCAVVKDDASRRARELRRLFSVAALLIIGTHILATICAAVALARHGLHSTETAALATDAAHAAGSSAHLASRAAPSLVVAAFLLVELILLGAGFGVHRALHHSRVSSGWALSRLVAEINRSVRALGGQHVYLEYLFRLGLPLRQRPLLRTLNVLHLRSTRGRQRAPWQSLRATYVDQRLTNPDPKKGQIAYYGNGAANDRRRLRVANGVFVTCSLLAIAAAASKLLLLLGVISLPAALEPSSAAVVLGTLAVSLPVLAVGGVSWAAAMDYEARVHTYSEMRVFLQEQAKRLERAASQRELQNLLIETETRLLRETADWFSRRTFAGVA